MLKKFLILAILGSLALLALLVVGWVTFHEKLPEAAMASILVASNSYGTLLLVILLSYGLAFIPSGLWAKSDKK